MIFTTEWDRKMVDMISDETFLTNCETNWMGFRKSLWRVKNRWNFWFFQSNKGALENASGQIKIENKVINDVVRPYSWLFLFWCHLGISRNSLRKRWKMCSCFGFFSSSFKHRRKKCHKINKLNSIEIKLWFYRFNNKWKTFFETCLAKWNEFKACITQSKGGKGDSLKNIEQRNKALYYAFFNARSDKYIVVAVFYHHSNAFPFASRTQKNKIAFLRNLWNDD